MRTLKPYSYAYTHYRCSKNLVDTYDGDDYVPNMAGFHLQQAGEFIIKCILDNTDIKPSYTHNITALLDLVAINNAPLYITDYMYAASGTISAWESCSRCEHDALLTYHEVRLGLDNIAKFMELNGCIPQLRSELQNPDTYAALERAVGDISSLTDIEKNCLYQVTLVDINQSTPERSTQLFT